MTPLLQVLDEARWAPSGDNTQPWRFEPRGDRHVVVHGRDTRDHVVYDLRGEASQLSLGALLETMAIAATRFGWSTQVTRRLDMPETQPTFDVCFDAAGRPQDDLVGAITTRSVQRLPLSTRALTDAQRSHLHAALPAGYRIVWLEGAANRWRCAGLMFSNAYVRLVMPEAYRVHRDVIEWNASVSAERVPDQALGADRLTLLVMRVAMQSWNRVHFANRFLAGTWLPRLQMDWLPSLRCAAHLVLIADREPDGVDDFVAAGRAVQRLWLAATNLGLWQQPEMTPLIFARYLRQGVPFTQTTAALDQARRNMHSLEALLGADAPRAVWMGRIGAGQAPKARSIRRPLSDLLIDRQPR